MQLYTGKSEHYEITVETAKDLEFASKATLHADTYDIMIYNATLL